MSTQLQATANEEIDLPHRLPAGHQSARGGYRAVSIVD
jgi:hypothetical protein